MAAAASTFVVLGLVAKKPGSGYDIAAFAERTVRYFWPISRSQLYTELTRLEQLGWASGTAVQQARYPNKRVYEISPQGLEALREWLDAEPQTQRQRTQDAMVLKVFLGSFMSPERLAEQLRDCRERAEVERTALSGTVEHLGAKPGTGSHLFGRASARFGVLQAEATIAWTEEVQALIEAEAFAEAE